MRYLAFFILTLTLLSFNAYANDVDQLRTYVQTSLERQQARAKMQDMDIRYKGDVLVEDAGGYYAITMPAIEVRDIGDGTYVDLGIISVNAAKAEKAGEDMWRMRTALATPIRIKDVHNIVIGNIHIPDQNIEMLWNAKADIFTQIFASLKNIRIEPTTEDVAVNIGQVLFNTNLEGLQVDKLITYNQSLDTWQKKTKQENFQPSEADLAILESLAGFYLADYLTAQNSQFEMRNISIKPISKPGLDIQTVKLDGAYNTLADNGMGILFNVQLGGIKAELSKQAGQEKGVENTQDFSQIPLDSIGFSFNLTDAPRGESLIVLKEIIKQSMSQALKPKSEAEQTIDFENLIKAAQNKGTKLKAKFTLGQTEVYSIDQLYEVLLNPSSKMGATGKASVIFENFDAVKQLMTGAVGLAAEGVDPNVLFSVVETLAKKETAPNGKQRLVFNIVLDETGEAKLNGLPIQNVIAAAMPAIMMMQAQTKASQSAQ